MELEGGNNPGNRVYVSDNGEAKTFSVSVTDQSNQSVKGKAFNLNSGLITLTDAVETPIFFLRNDTEIEPLIVPKVFYTIFPSTGGTGKVKINLYKQITGGTILDATDLVLQNFNASDSSVLAGSTTSKIGATGVTFSGGTIWPEIVLLGPSIRSATDFETIVLPRGSNLLVTLTPPVGNTSMEVELGCNLYVKEKEIA